MCSRSLWRWKWTIASLLIFFVSSNSITSISEVLAQSFNSPTTTATLTSGAAEWFAPASTIRYRSTTLTLSRDTKIITGLVTWHKTSGDLQIHAMTAPSYILNVAYNFSTYNNTVTLFNRPSGSATLGISSTVIGNGFRFYEVSGSNCRMELVPTFSSSVLEFRLPVTGCTVAIYLATQGNPSSFTVDDSTTSFTFDSTKAIFKTTSAGLVNLLQWSANPPAGGGGISIPPIEQITPEKIQDIISQAIIAQQPQPPQLDANSAIIIVGIIVIIGSIVFVGSRKISYGQVRKEVGGVGKSSSRKRNGGF